MRSRGPISADERHSYAEEEIGTRLSASSKESERGEAGRGRERERKREIDRRTRGRSATRHARRDDQREREGPCCSAMKAQPRNPLSRATQLNSRSRRPPAPGGRRAHDAAALALDHSSCCRRPRRRRPPAWHTLQTPSLCCCSRHPSAFRAAIDATPVSVASTRACVRNGGRGVWRAPQ